MSDSNSNDPNWSPDGKWVTFSHIPQLTSM
ncbi:MAG: PD40 domain-containing protein [Ignavibacteria bacterium]|nr:PD40 domain-containing protein [Ignavibacteria bacterium]